MAQDNIIDNEREKTKMRFNQLTTREKEMLSEAVWRCQRRFIAGDKLFNEYGQMLDEILEGMDYVPGRIL